jgi:hypothetical protein
MNQIPAPLTSPEAPMTSGDVLAPRILMLLAPVLSVPLTVSVVAVAPVAIWQVPVSVVVTPTLIVKNLNAPKSFPTQVMLPLAAMTTVLSPVVNVPALESQLPETVIVLVLAVSVPLAAIVTDVAVMK